MRFIGPDIYADYKGYLKCIVYFEPRQGNGLPLIHLDGPWKRYQQHGKSVLHRLSAAEVGGVRRVSAVVDEMTKKGAPSKATIQSWRKEFALVLFTSTVRVGWLNLITTCNIMRCKDGHIVEDTAMLVTKRGLKCSISANAALEAAEEVNLTYNDNIRTLTFEGLVSTVSSKVESECMRDVEDREIACAVYVASSWFSTDGPRADEGKDFVWGNRHIETKDNSEIVQWLPKTMGVLHMAGWRVVPTINVSG